MIDKKLKQLVHNKNIFTLVVLFVIVGIFYMYNIYLAIATALATIVIIYLNWLKNIKRTRALTEYVENLTRDIDESSHRAILNAPVPMIIVEDSGEIVWYNQLAAEIFKGRSLADDLISEVIKGFTFAKQDETITHQERIDDHFYTIRQQTFQTDKNSSRILHILYFQDITDFHKLEQKYRDKRPVVALIQVDNYEDVINETKEDKRPFVTSEIDKKISLWASRINGILKKIDRDEYIIIFEAKYMTLLEAKRFVILDEIREIDMGNRVAPTLSIGVTSMGNTMAQTEDYASSALELALGRGGDQAVVRKQSDFEFYGGKSKAVEKRNKVKARIIAHALRPIIDESEKIYIMGHKYPDMDSYGSAIGMYQAALNRGKEAFIVLEEVNESIVIIHDNFKDDETFNFIQPQQAIENFSERDLLIIVDTHRPNFTESPELENIATRKVLFDHHRRGKEFIEDTLLTYLEPYASSASELITEVLQYMERKVVLEKKVAEALLAGITVDTKNFSVKTGVRTFESAAMLRRFDADTTTVKNFFKDDLDTFVARSNIVSNAEMIFKEIAISVTDDDIKNARLVAAQGADSLLNIRGVKGAFVVIREEAIIYVSGRSLGDINCQVILEKLGGGGHYTSAGAQFEDIEIEEVRRLLVEAIEQYLKEED